MIPPQKDRILITGGAGFIGSALVWGLNQRGQSDIVLTDHLGEDERWKNLVGLRFTDYIDADDLIQHLEQNPDYLGQVGLVLHLGACSATTERDAGYLMKNNFEYTKRLAHWALEHGARFVYASSAATYGDGSQGMNDLEEDLSRLRPLNMYGYSKHLFDTYAQATGISGSVIGLKYFNVYGPNENHKGDMRSLVNKSFDQILKTGKVQLFKSNHPDFRDGEQMRDFLYIKDAVEMTLHLAFGDVSGGLYNLGSGTASTWIELVTAIFGAMGMAPNIDFIEMPEALREKYQNYTCADITKLRDAGYRRSVSPLDHAVYDYVVHYLAPGKFLGTDALPTPSREEEPPPPTEHGTIPPSFPQWKPTASEDQATREEPQAPLPTSEKARQPATDSPTSETAPAPFAEFIKQGTETPMIKALSQKLEELRKHTASDLQQQPQAREKQQAIFTPLDPDTPPSPKPHEQQQQTPRSFLPQPRDKQKP